MARPRALPLALALGALATTCEDRRSSAPDAPHVAHQPRSPGAGADVVMLCDGHTTARVPPGPATRQTGAAVAADLMAQWRARNPDRGWAPDPDPAHDIVRGADNSDLVGATDGGASQGPGHAYGSYSRQDILVWEREVQRAVVEGDRVFHDADALGSTIAVSCDMCHPNAANTHPETYPKFQVQLGRVALLRDMINWCLQHPVRAPVMAADDPRMRAMEAYIYAQRRGVALNYGRH